MTPLLRVVPRHQFPREVLRFPTLDCLSYPTRRRVPTPSNFSPELLAILVRLVRREDIYHVLLRSARGRRNSERTTSCERYHTTSHDKRRRPESLNRASVMQYLKRFCLSSAENTAWIMEQQENDPRILILFLLHPVSAQQRGGHVEFILQVLFTDSFARTKAVNACWMVPAAGVVVHYPALHVDGTAVYHTSTPAVRL